MDDDVLVNFLRVTSALEIEHARSGHPGICLGAAPIAYSIFKSATLDAKDPSFINRDRIVFSAGHASALLYASLHLFGFDLTIDDLKSFRRLGSKTPGHPELDTKIGVDATTGPLGEGVAMSVGFAIAEEFLRNKFQRGVLSPISHYTFCLVGDGCLMEGVAQEAISLAGTLKLRKLIMLYDKNDMTIEGPTRITNNDNIKNKFLACNWDVIEVEDGNNVSKIMKAIETAKEGYKPTVIIVHTTIGFGSRLEGTNIVHGRPPLEEDISILRKNLGYDFPDFAIPNLNYVCELRKDKNLKVKKYYEELDEYKRKFKEEYKAFIELEDNFNYDFSNVTLPPQDKFDARKAVFNLLNSLYDDMPTLIGGSADLSPSTKTFFKGTGYFSSLERGNRNIAFGIREHAMAGICNGISLHGGLRAFCSTFLSFSNFMAPALRLSCMMPALVLYIFTHDSFFVGEDGPTHQPVEQIATLRATPNLNVFRPCGEEELKAGFQVFFSKDKPMAIILPRQVCMKVKDNFNKALFGGYQILSSKNSKLTIVATGSEVKIAIDTAKILRGKKIYANVVSMPCTEIFESMPKAYRDKVLGKGKDIFCIEASSDNIWYKFASSFSHVFKVDKFPKSAKGDELQGYMGFDPKILADKILKIIK